MEESEAHEYERSVNGDKALRARWRELWKRMGAQGGADVPCQRLLDLWGDPARAYHTKQHLAHGLAEFDDVHASSDDPETVAAAWWFHDAIYLPPIDRPSSEEQSAHLARKMLQRAGMSEAFVRRVSDLILATTHRDHPTGAPMDIRLITDIDLAIFGQPESVFDAYEVGIRAEYRHVSNDPFRAGRANVLRRFLKRKPIYTTDHFRAKYEDAARANLERSLARLESSGPLVVAP